MTPTPDPISSPPPVPGAFRPSLTGAVFGPVMLMIIGALFALEYAGGPAVAKTWPALIIAAGLLKLAEFMGARNS